jgi:hypothetical protein
METRSIAFSSSHARFGFLRIEKRITKACLGDVREDDTYQRVAPTGIT